ncbi:FmdB family zinc ribbon protein [Piscinibacter sp.]|jgi:putative FmdB family regulatory protein|uniref:FmdB family zinc ribbon protein n=1 Tax=Piscinibacter sp. TaxID=1903157 RepID=UPI002F414528
MPIYAYRCESCGHAKDVLQKISDPVLSTCPACGAADFKKQLTAAGFQLKGSGWYVTDFKGGASSVNTVAKTDTAKPDATPAPAAASEAAASSTSSGDGAAAGGCGSSCACH